MMSQDVQLQCIDAYDESKDYTPHPLVHREDKSLVVYECSARYNLDFHYEPPDEFVQWEDYDEYFHDTWELMDQNKREYEFKWFHKDRF
jgi:hypothetical protein